MKQICKYAWIALAWSSIAVNLRYCHGVCLVKLHHIKIMEKNKQKNKKKVKKKCRGKNKTENKLCVSDDRCRNI